MSTDINQAYLDSKLAGEKLESSRSTRMGGWDASEVIGKDGIEEGAFTGIDIHDQRWNTWHGRGVYLEDKKVMSVEEAISYVPTLGMTINPKPVGWQSDDGEWHIIPEDVANVRTDGTYLATVTKKYYRVQPWEAFKWIDDLLDSSEAKLANVMTLRGGREIALLAIIDSSWKVLGADELFKWYLLLTNSYDRSTGMDTAITAVRAQCTNSTTLALKTAPRVFSMRHTESITGKLQTARQTLGLVATYQAEFAQVAEELASASFSDSEFEQFLDSLIPAPEPKKDKLTGIIKPVGDRALANIAEAKGAIANIYTNATNLSHVRGTKWAALNATTEYCDWVVRVTGKTPELADERRMRRQLESNPLKDRALELLTV